MLLIVVRPRALPASSLFVIGDVAGSGLFIVDIRRLGSD